MEGILAVLLAFSLILLTTISIGPTLVTGASTGIGRTITEFLSSRGHPIFAGARKEKDLKVLGELPNVTPIKLDVTSVEDVGAAADRIHDHGDGLYGLVNNAGVGDWGPLIDLSVEDLHRVLNVNFYGVHRMIRALIPFLIQSGGRIVNISSTAGINTPRFFGSYSASKHALEAYSDILRDELAQFGVKVSTINPGNFRSEAAINWARNVLPVKKGEFMSTSRYREELSETLTIGWLSPEELQHDTGPEPHPVAEAAYHALFAEAPKPRYVVGGGGKSPPNAPPAVIHKIIETLCQVNQGLTGSLHSLRKEEIVELLTKQFDTTGIK